MEVVIVCIALFFAAGYVYKAGKRDGSRAGYWVGRHRRGGGR